VVSQVLFLLHNLLDNLRQNHRASHLHNLRRNLRGNQLSSRLHNQVLSLHVNHLDSLHLCQLHNLQVNQLSSHPDNQRERRRRSLQDNLPVSPPLYLVVSLLHSLHRSPQVNRLLYRVHSQLCNPRGNLQWCQQASLLRNRLGNQPINPLGSLLHSLHRSLRVNLRRNHL
jgi:hypothetical protein